MKAIQININGMTCHGCANSIHRILTNIQGVTKADVSWQDGLATVAFDPQQTNIDILKTAIEEAGFDVNVP